MRGKNLKKTFSNFAQKFSKLEKTAPSFFEGLKISEK